MCEVVVVSLVNSTKLDCAIYIFICFAVEYVNSLYKILIIIIVICDNISYCSSVK